MAILTKRVYALPSEADGYRILVDRLGPRGLSKVVAALDEWLREVAPSTELRKWYDHQVERWPEFRVRYRRELQATPELLDGILEHERSAGTVTLLYAARDELHNEALVLAEALRDRASAPISGGG
jgi:uncharacterized protein YeaO (DUF488 family)